MAGAPNSPAGTSAAQQMVNAALAPLMNNLNQQQSSLGQTQAQQQAALRGYTQQIIGYLKGTPRAIAGDYNGAIAQQNGFANQYANQQRQANPDAAIQADLRAIHAPAAQIAQLAAQNQKAYGTSAANLYALGGAIPNSQFAADKAANLGFARSLPAIEGLRGQQLFQGLLANQAKDTQALASQRADLQSKAAFAALSAGGPGSTKAPTTRGFKDGTTREWNPQTRSWDVVATAPPSTRGGVTSSTRAKALGLAQTFYEGIAPVTRADGTVSKPGKPPVKYQPALRRLRAIGLSLNDAQQILDSFYGRGEGGRPLLSFQQRQALIRRGVNKKAIQQAENDWLNATTPEGKSAAESRMSALFGGA